MDQNWVQLANTIDGDFSNDNFGFSVSLSQNGNIVAIGAPNYNGNGNDIGEVKVFTLSSGNWVQLGNNLYGSEDNCFFGASISLSSDGSTLAIGEPGFNLSNNDSGQVKVFKLISGSWSQIGNNIDGDVNAVFFGNYVKLSNDGNTIAISDFNFESVPSKIGKIKVYSLNTNIWTEKGTPITNLLGDDNLQHSISLNDTGDIMAIGIPANDEIGLDSGKVKVYNFVLDDWVQLGNDINGNNVGDYFGFELNLSSSGDVLAIGSPNYNSSGKVDLYKFVDNNWSQLGNIMNVANENDLFGISISLSNNNILVVGAINNDSNGLDSGQVNIYDVNTFLSIETKEQNSFKIYPNPVSNFLRIQSTENLFFEMVNIYDMTGKLIKPLKNIELKTIDVSNLEKGLYLLELILTNSNFREKFIVK